MTSLTQNSAAEFRFFALYISSIILSRYFTGAKRKYLTHWVFLIQALWILSSYKINATDLSRAENLIKLFVLQVGSLYGTEFWDLEVHLLLHLADQVKRFGPLWTHGCWVFEHMVGQIKRITHGRNRSIHRSIMKVYQRQYRQIMHRSMLLYTQYSGI